MTADGAGAVPSCAAEGVRYADYLCLDALLAAQRPRSAQRPPAIHDEHFFIVLHQAQELWFKQILREAAAVVALPPAHPRFFPEALPLLERIAAIETALVQQLSLLRTLDAAQFMAMRPLLGTASGAQSLQFRLIEATAGVLAVSTSRTDVEMLPEVERAQVRAAMAAPSLHDVVIEALVHEAHRRGIAAADAPVSPVSPGRRGFEALPGEVAMLLNQVLARRSARGAGAGEPVDRAICLALDALCRFEDGLLAWRGAHAAVVRELLDELPGTGGTAGHAYLRARLVAQPRSALAGAVHAARGALQ